MATKVLEDEILEALELIDGIRKTLPEAETAVTAAKKLLAEVQTRIGGETSAAFRHTCPAFKQNSK